MNHTANEELQQAARDEVDIREAGIYENFRADLNYELQRRRPAPSGDGPLMRVHGERWRSERFALQKQVDHDIWQVGCDLAHREGVDVDAGMSAARAAINDVAGRVRAKWTTIAHLILAGVQVDLPATLAEEVADQNDPQPLKGNTDVTFTPDAPSTPDKSASLRLMKGVS